MIIQGRINFKQLMSSGSTGSRGQYYSKNIISQIKGYHNVEYIKTKIATINGEIEVIRLRKSKDELDSVYGDSASSFTTVKFRIAELKRDCTSLGDDEHSGRPNAAITDENIAKVHQLVLEDHRIKVRDSRD
ncbi:HTH_48 domain-containing protein [Trichonephila clavipes]|nr:HTH_48 domain-containing protein [Trichonephila clavipes]